MEVEILHQWAGKNCLYERLREFLKVKPRRFDRLRILMAFARWSGFGLIHSELLNFAKAGGKIEAILGIDAGGTTPEALRYLLEHFPHGKIWLFGVPRQAMTFHPKVLIFESKQETMAIIGSANLTGGGFATNFEVCVSIHLDPTQTKTSQDGFLITTLDNLWNTYVNPQPPLKNENLLKLDGDLLDQIAEKLGSEHVHGPDETSGNETTNLMPDIEIELPKAPSRPPTTIISTRGKQLKRKITEPLPKIFYMQILRETGADGSQVQIPVQALKEYFNIEVDETAFIKLRHTNWGVERRRILHFPNNTHRIQINRVSGKPRPLIMRFVRKNIDVYRCDLALSGTYQYKNWLRKCPRRTRLGSKRWGVD